MKKLKCKIIIIVLISFAFAFINNCGRGDDKVKTEILITANWGDKEGEFGIYDGEKIPDKYGIVDFIITKDAIYILDGLNGRIQVFDLKGNFKKKIIYVDKWENFGLAWDFTLYKNNFYMLVGTSPYYYSTGGYKEIHKFSYNGKLINTFGKKYSDLMVKKHLDRMESYYGSISSSLDKGYVGVQANWDILLFNAEGNFEYNVSEIIEKNPFVYSLHGIDPEGDLVIGESNYNLNYYKTIVFDVNEKKIKLKVDGRYEQVDSKGNFYFVRTYAPKRNNPELVTEITKYDSETKTINKYKISGNIKAIKNSSKKVFHYRESYVGGASIYKVDPHGNIYHLISLDDGLVLRKIAVNSSK